MVNGWYEPLMALLRILLKAQMMSVGALEEAIPALQELKHALVTIPDPREGTKTRKEGDEGLT